MTLPQQKAKHVRELYLGGNRTTTNDKENLLDVTLQQATTKIDSLNTIAALVYHINYYVSAVLKVLQGGLLDAHDKYSFDHTPILSQADWENLLTNTWADAENLASLVEQLPENILWEDFADKKYGNYYRNVSGIIEHTHYHLGQIVLIKRMLIHADGNRSYRT